MNPPLRPCRHRLASLTATTCSECGVPLTLGVVSRHYGEALVQWAKETAVIACPHCGRTVPIYNKTCPRCRDTITVGASAKASVGPACRRWQRMNQSSPRQARVLRQSAYLLSSAVLFGWQFATDSYGDFGRVMIRVMVSSILLAFLGLIAVWVLPRHFVGPLVARASVVIKLGLIFNYLSLVLLIQSCIAGWFERSLVLLGLIISTWVGAAFLHRHIWPVAVGVRQIFRDRDGGYFDPSQPQGRQGGFE